MDTDDIMDKQNEYKNDKMEVLANWHYFLLLGESGLGKSTLMSSLFLNDLYKDRKVPGVEGKPIPDSGKINLRFLWTIWRIPHNFGDNYMYAGQELASTV